MLWVGVMLVFKIPQEVLWYLTADHTRLGQERNYARTLQARAGCLVLGLRELASFSVARYAVVAKQVRSTLLSFALPCNRLGAQWANLEWIGGWALTTQQKCPSGPLSITQSLGFAAHCLSIRLTTSMWRAGLFVGS